MHEFRVGNAPVSWGVDQEFPLPPERVLAEIAQAGYAGTETGPPGYLPTDPARVRALLEAHGLALASAYVPFHLHLPQLPEEEVEYFERVCRALAAVGADTVLLADAGNEHRMARAGRVGAGDGLDATGWRDLARHLHRLADLAARQGLQAAFHPHVGTFVETRHEVARLVDLLGDGPVGLCPDTGHLAYGGSDPVEVFRSYAGRIRYCHLKDLDRDLLEDCQRRGLGWADTVASGVFVPLGRGDVDHRAIMDCLAAAGYRGWLIVEQDRVLGPDSHPLQDAMASRAFLEPWT